MGTKIIKSILVLALFLVSSTCFAEEIVRVGITDNSFQRVKHSDVEVYSTGEYLICDKDTKQVIAKVPSSKTLRIIHEEDSILVNVDNERTLALQSFVLVSEKGLLGIEGLKRAGKPALYHGALEFCRTQNKDGFYIINLVEIQDYLKGVVPNEMPIRFGLEALKAQTVAARNYVLAPRVKAYEEFDVFDSVASQVYFGANTEEDLATKAVEQTNGHVATYNGELILALYSSTAGGYTESYSNAFSDKYQFPAEDKPYLHAKPDMLTFVPMNDEENARKFFTSIPTSYDMDSPYFRWQKTWTLAEFEKDINTNLKLLSNTGFITPPPVDYCISGIKDIKILKRGDSGKVMEMELSTVNGNYLVRKELIIRKLFVNKGKILPSANFVLDITRDETTGRIIDITAIGAGYGHGVGMSQFGAGFMGEKLGKNYQEILKHYYSDILVTTNPVELLDKEIKQEFYLDEPNGVLVIENPERAKTLRARVNGLLLEIELNKGFMSKLQEYDISKYLKKGDNEIIFYPNENGKSLKLFVHLCPCEGEPVQTKEEKKKEELNDDIEDRN